MIDRFARFVTRRAGWVLAMHAALTIFFTARVVDLRDLELRLDVRTEIEKILPEKGAYREFYAHFRQLFGSFEMVFVGLVSDDVFSHEGLERIQRVTKRLEQVDGVRRVLSLSNAPGIRSEDGDVRITTLYDDVPEDEDSLARIRARILGDPMHAGNLVSEDGSAAALLVFPDEMSEREFRERGVDQEIERVVREAVGDGAQVLMAGNPSLKAMTGRILLRDLLRLVPLSFLFMAAIAFYSFRSLPGVAVPLISIGMAQLWTAAAMVMLDRSLNLVTFIVPLLINALGFAYSVHLVSDHDEEMQRGRFGQEAAGRALARVSFPVFLTAVTTAAGFLSLCLSRLPAIREFGAFCVVGVLASLVASLTLAPAILTLAARKPRPVGRRSSSEDMERVAGRIAAFDVRHRRKLLWAGAAVAVLAIVGTTRIVVSTSFVANLKADNPLRISSYAFDRELGGSTTFHVVLESEEAEAFKQPANLEQVRSLQQWLDRQPEVSKTTSLADYLMVVNRAFHGGDESHFRLPETKRAISQFLFFFWNDSVEDLVTAKYDAVHVMARAPAVNSQAINAFIDRVEARLLELPGHLVGHITGDTVLIGRTMDEIAWGQAVSLTGAIVIIYAILLAYFRSFRVALLALVPNTLPVAVYFGVLGLSGVTLNIITSLIACIVLGIAVDDTIHFIVRFREKVEELGDEPRAAVAALRTVARPVTSTTAALCAGFLVLGGSGLHHQVEFALLSTSMLAFAWLVDMTFTPALCAGMKLAGRSGVNGS